MKFKAPTVGPIPASPGIGPSRGKPDWLKEWLENLPSYVLLSCGHYEDLTYRGLLILAVFGATKRRDVLCERCNIWASVTRSATMHEFFGLPPQTHAQEPMF